jgi:hypothetical protein
VYVCAVGRNKLRDILYTSEIRCQYDQKQDYTQVGSVPTGEFSLRCFIHTRTRENSMDV